MRQGELKEPKVNDRRVWYRFDVDPDTDLLAYGIIVPAIIEMPRPARLRASYEGTPVPHPINCDVLIDTGSNVSHISPEIARDAHLKLIERGAEIEVVDGQKVRCDKYVGEIMLRLKTIRSGQPYESRFPIFTEFHASKAAKPNKYQGLIGRDVMRYFDLRVNGRTGEIALRFTGHPR